MENNSLITDRTEFLQLYAFNVTIRDTSDTWWEMLNEYEVNMPSVFVPHTEMSDLQIVSCSRRPSMQCPKSPG